MTWKVMTKILLFRIDNSFFNLYMIILTLITDFLIHFWQLFYFISNLKMQFWLFNLVILSFYLLIMTFYLIISIYVIFLTLTLWFCIIIFYFFDFFTVLIIMAFYVNSDILFHLKVLLGNFFSQSKW